MSKMKVYDSAKRVEILVQLNLCPAWSVEVAELVFNGVRDGTHDSPKPVDNGYKLVTSKNLKNEGIDFSNVNQINEVDYLEIRKRSAVATNDILFSMIGTIGNVAIVGCFTDFAIKNVALFKNNEILILPKIAMYWLKSDIYQKYLQQNIKGGTQKFISLGSLRESPIPLIPLAEQQEIVRQLDIMLAQVEQIKARLDVIPIILKKFRQSVLADAVSRKLTEEWREQNKNSIPDFEGLKVQKSILIKNKNIKKDLEVLTAEQLFDLPISWNNLALQSFASKITDGEHSTPKREEVGHYLLSARNVRDGYIDLTNVDYVGAEEFFKLRKRCDPNKGDVLISCSGSVGRITLVDKDNEYVMVRSAALVKTLGEFVNNKFLMFVLQSPYLQKQITEKSKSTAQSNLFLGQIKELSIPYPSLQEQIEIVRQVEILFRKAAAIEMAVQSAQKRVNLLTQSILAKAFSGELTAEWRAQHQDLITGVNSAEALLAKIQAEQKMSKPVKKTRAKKES